MGEGIFRPALTRHTAMGRNFASVPWLRSTASLLGATTHTQETSRQMHVLLLLYIDFNGTMTRPYTYISPSNCSPLLRVPRCPKN